MRMGWANMALVKFAESTLFFLSKIVRAFSSTSRKRTYVERFGHRTCTRIPQPARRWRKLPIAAGAYSNILIGNVLAGLLLDGRGYFYYFFGSAAEDSVRIRRDTGAMHFEIKYRLHE